MADKDTKEDLDLDTEQVGKSKTNLLIIILIVAILAVGGGVAAVFLLGGDDEDKGSEEDAAEAAPAHPAAIYSKMHRPFIINFEDTKKARFLQLEISVMSHDQHSIDLFVEHTPVIRNAFVTVLSSQSFDVMNSREGKEKLNKVLLKLVNDTLTTEVADNPAPPSEEEDDDDDEKSTHDKPAHDESSKTEHTYIKKLYFISLVMQ